jgi:hypothetical protein
MSAAPFLPGCFELLREKSEWRPALVLVGCTRIPGGETELQQFRIIHRAEVGAESLKVEGTGPKHCVPLNERVRKDSTCGSSHARRHNLTRPPTTRSEWADVRSMPESNWR